MKKTKRSKKSYKKCSQCHRYIKKQKPLLLRLTFDAYMAIIIGGWVFGTAIYVTVIK